MSLRLKILISFMLCIVLTFFSLLTHIMQTKVKDFQHKTIRTCETLQLLNSKSNEIRCLAIIVLEKLKLFRASRL